MQIMDSFSVHGRRLLEDRNILQSSAPIGPPAERLEGSREVPHVVTTKYVLILAIIISALFCSLLCALVVSALIRCRLRCRRWHVVSEPSLHEDVERTHTAIKKIDIKALPVTMCYMHSPFAGNDCPICLAEFLDGEKKPSAIARPAAEPVERAQMHLHDGNESIEANHVVQSLHILGDVSTLAVS